MHKTEFVQENEMYKTLWDFEIQTDLRILARKPDVDPINKKKKKRSEGELIVKRNSLSLWILE